MAYILVILLGLAGLQAAWAGEFPGHILEQIHYIETHFGARVGIAVYDPESHELRGYHGGDRFPMMSTFKTLACAKLLFDADKDTGAKEAGVLDRTVVINKAALVSWSPVTERLVGQRISLARACRAAMVMSDNTAANIVLTAIGGPEALTGFIRSLGDPVTRLDRMEPELNTAAKGDPRDTTTPDAMVLTLSKLIFGEMLSEPARDQLLQWMIQNRVADSLLRSVLPRGWSIADRSGAGANGSRGIAAVVWPGHRPPLVVGIYLTGHSGSFQQRNQSVAAIGREIFRQYQ